MANIRLAFFGAEAWQKEALEKNKGLAGSGVGVSFFEGVLNAENIPEQTDFEALSIFVDSTIDKGVLDKFPNLKFIATRSTGFDHIDLEACRERSIVVSNIPSYGANTVAEHAFGLLLALSKRIYDGYEQVRESGKFDPSALRGFDLKGKTLGIIGTGRIGKHSARIGIGFGMKIVGYDPYPDEKFAKEVGMSYLSLKDLLEQSDVVTIHAPYMESTHHLINSETIMHMKKGSVLINTSRGPIVETQALLGALQSGQLLGAGLDVLEEEGVIKDELNFLVSGSAEGHNLKTVLADHVLIDLPNVIVTPHSAFNTKEALQRIMETTMENIISFVEKKSQNVVSLE